MEDVSFSPFSFTGIPVSSTIVAPSLMPEASNNLFQTANQTFLPPSTGSSRLSDKKVKRLEGKAGIKTSLRTPLSKEEIQFINNIKKDLLAHLQTIPHLDLLNSQLYRQDLASSIDNLTIYVNSLIPSLEAFRKEHNIMGRTAEKEIGKIKSLFEKGLVDAIEIQRGLSNDPAGDIIFTEHTTVGQITVFQYFVSDNIETLKEALKGK